jgi:hypothetical protein
MDFWIFRFPDFPIFGLANFLPKTFYNCNHRHYTLKTKKETLIFSLLFFKDLTRSIITHKNAVLRAKSAIIQA